MAYTDAVGLANKPTNGSINLKTSSITGDMTFTGPPEEHESAGQSVLETNELLENILSYLPAKKSFVIQRVSKRWNSIIATSPSIQRKLFTFCEQRKRNLGAI